MTGLPTCWQHFKDYVSEMEPDALSSLNLGHVDYNVRGQLESIVKNRTLAQETKFCEGLLNIVGSFDDWRCWDTDRQAQPQDWANITRLKVESNIMPELPPNLKELDLHITGYTVGDATIPGTVRYLKIRSSVELRFTPPDGIQELIVEGSATLSSLDLTNYGSLWRLDLTGVRTDVLMGPLTLGSTLKDVSLGPYLHSMPLKDMFPHGATNLERLELGKMPHKSSIAPQELFTLLPETFPQLYSLTLYNPEKITYGTMDVVLRIPPSVKHLEIPVMYTKMRETFMGTVRRHNQLRMLRMPFGKNVSIECLPTSLEELVLTRVSNRNTIELTKLPNLSTFRLETINHGYTPDIQLSHKISSLYVGGQRFQFV